MALTGIFALVFLVLCHGIKESRKPIVEINRRRNDAVRWDVGQLCRYRHGHLHALRVTQKLKVMFKMRFDLDVCYFTNY